MVVTETLLSTSEGDIEPAGVQEESGLALGGLANALASTDSETITFVAPSEPEINVEASSQLKRFSDDEIKALVASAKAWRLSEQPPADGELPAAERRVARLGRQSRDLIVECFTPLIWHFTGRYYGVTMKREDLFQEGVIELLNTIDKYDPDRGVSFYTYADRNIRGAMLHALRDQDALVKNRPKFEIGTKVFNAQMGLVQELGREPTAQEIADRIGRPVGMVQRALMPLHTDSLDVLQAVQSQRVPAALDELQEDALVELVDVQRLMNRAGLSDLERAVINRRYITDGAFQREVAKELGCSQMHVSRAERRALEKLRAALEE